VDESTTGSAFRSGTPVIADSFRHRSWGSPTSEHQALVMAPRTQDAVVGVIAVARKAEQASNIDDLDLMSDLANHAALTLVADRERIAHDLHDHVIQRLFTGGMDLQGTIGAPHRPEITARLTRTIDDLQTTIDDIRTRIFNLRAPTARPLRRRLSATGTGRGVAADRQPRHHDQRADLPCPSTSSVGNWRITPKPSSPKRSATAFATPAPPPLSSR
jgi:Histidine kinase/GAF domain